MKAERIFAIIAAVYLLVFFAHAVAIGKTVYGDGVYYFAWLRSIVVDGDVHFANDYGFLGVTQPTTSMWLPRNMYSIGPALLWLPNYFMAHRVLGVAGLPAQSGLPAGRQGYDLPHQLVVGATSVLFAITGLILLFRLLSAYVTERISLWVTIAIAFTTNLFFYGSVDPANSHAVSFFAATALLSLLLARSKSWTAIGVFLALLGLIRTQDLFLGILILPFINQKAIVPLFTGFFIAFFPQLYLWHLFYGTWGISPYFAEGQGFINLLHPQVLDVLVGAHSGLFLWTPTVALAFVGLIMLSENLRRFRTIFLTVFLGELYLVAGWWDPGQGGSYSGRMFISVLPILAFGLAQLFRRLGKHRLFARYLGMVIVVPLAIINALLILTYLVAS